jgi:hypothetical protein
MPPGYRQLLHIFKSGREGFVAVGAAAYPLYGIRGYDYFHYSFESHHAAGDVEAEA